MSDAVTTKQTESRDTYLFIKGLVRLMHIVGRYKMTFAGLGVYKLHP